MTHVTSPTPTASSPNDAAARELLAGVPLYADASPEHRAAIERDMARCLADGLPVEDYLTSLAEYADAAEYLAQAGDGEDSTASEEQAPVPTSTLKQANATLSRFGEACRDQVDANYRLAALAWDYVQQFLGAAPGKAQRSTAIESLAEEWRKWDEDSMAVPVALAMKRLKERVNLLLRCHAVATLLGDGRGVAKGNGTRKGRGKGGADTRLAWGTLRELCPLVHRDEDDHAETWSVLPSVAEQARALVVEIAASGMARKDVVAAVAKLMLADAGLELRAARESGDKARVSLAEQAVERWGGKVERTNPAAPTASQAGDKPAEGGKGKAGKDKPATGEGEGKDGAPIGPGECRQPGNLLRSVASATAKDAAGLLSDALMGHDECDDVLRELLRMLDGHPDLHATSKAAVAEALAILDDGDEGEDGDSTRREAQAALAALKRPMADDDADAA